VRYEFTLPKTPQAGMLKITVTERYVGLLLISNLDNTQQLDLLDKSKRLLEARLREHFKNFSRADFLNLAVLKAYHYYYKKFDQNYHVQLQIESIAQKNKALPKVSPLVDANFLAELETYVLTAGHDAGLLVSPLLIDASVGGESFIQMNGTKKSLKPSDMIMSDSQGVVCSIIYGQDKRTAISAHTQKVLYVSYAPVGTPKYAVQEQLELILNYVRVYSPLAHLELFEIIEADVQGANSRGKDV
jgi:DNA/RNA-binding domain of Phe-tRNA-synthetase-like protein